MELDLTTIIGIALAFGGLIDACAGFLPDKWMPYIGITRRIVRRLLGIESKK